jgi:glycosyltransferase involved in cell wall biosynthesis
MRIAIDLASVRTTGTRIYSEGFLPALGRIGGKDDFLVFVPLDVANMVKDKLPSNMDLHVTAVTANVKKRLLWEQTTMPKLLQAWNADVLFAAFDIAPMYCPCPILLAVRNPSPFLLAKGWQTSPLAARVKAQVHRMVAYVSARKAKLVFYPTAYASKLLGDLMKVPLEKRAVIHHGTDHAFWTEKYECEPVLTQYDIVQKNYILFVSNFYFYKHPDVLIDAFSQCEKLIDQGTKLVFVGGAPDPIFEQKLHQQVNQLGLKNEVRFLGHIPRPHLPVLYQEAAAFVLPTVMETFGQPFVEAMASGLPVICADTEFAREICGEAALYFPAGDANSLAPLLEQVVCDTTVNTKLSEASLNRSKQFSWDREASETLSLLKKVGSKSI